MLATVLLVRQQQAIVRTFAEAAATTPATACSASQLGLKPGMAWHYLVGHAVLRCPGEGRYFVDLPNWQRMCRRRRCIAAMILGALVVTGVLVWWIASRH